MPDRPRLVDPTEFTIQGDQMVEKISPETLRLENYGQRMLEIQAVSRKEQGIEGKFILGED